MLWLAATCSVQAPWGMFKECVVGWYGWWGRRVSTCVGGAVPVVRGFFGAFTRLT